MASGSTSRHRRTDDSAAYQDILLPYTPLDEHDIAQWPRKGRATASGCLPEHADVQLSQRHNDTGTTLSTQQVTEVNAEERPTVVVSSVAKQSERDISWTRLFVLGLFICLVYFYIIFDHIMIPDYEMEAPNTSTIQHDSLVYDASDISAFLSNPSNEYASIAPYEFQTCNRSFIALRDHITYNIGLEVWAANKPIKNQLRAEKIRLATVQGNELRTRFRSCLDGLVGFVLPQQPIQYCHYDSDDAAIQVLSRAIEQSEELDNIFSLLLWQDRITGFMSWLLKDELDESTRYYAQLAQIVTGQKIEDIFQQFHGQYSDFFEQRQARNSISNILKNKWR